MQKLASLLLLTVLFVLCAGCAAAAPEAPALVAAESQPGPAEPTASKATVALVMKTLTNPFFVEMEKGARRAEAELGVHLLVKTGAQETSVEQQIAIIEGLIQDKVGAIVIAPADSGELIPVLKKAQDAGIIIINVDNRLDAGLAQKIGLVDVPVITVDNAAGAYLSAKHLSDQIKAPTEVAILEGIRTAQNATDRKNGALRAFEENPNVKIVALETANWKIDEAYTVTAGLFELHPDIKALFCANDMMALGAIQYLTETGRDDVLVAGYDALAEAKAALADGTLQATIDQQAALQAYTAVAYAVRGLKGEKLPVETLVDVKLVTEAEAQ